MYGEIPLRCPYGHDLGAIVITRHGIRHLTRDQFKDFKSGDTISDVKTVAAGQVIGALCLYCKQRSPRDKCWYEHELSAADSGERFLTLKPPLC
jgi:hypothetical protein